MAAHCSETETMEATAGAAKTKRRSCYVVATAAIAAAVAVAVAVVVVDVLLRVTSSSPAPMQAAGETTEKIRMFDVTQQLRLLPMVRNNRRWYDSNRGEEITANDGGHITRIGDTYYWVGNDQSGKEGEGNDIHLYSNGAALSSSNWRHVAKIVDIDPGTYSGGCTLVRSPFTLKFLVICKGLTIYRADEVEGPYSLVATLWPSQVPFHSEYAWGGVSVYQHNDGVGYLAALRFMNNADPDETCHFAIYRLSEEYDSISEEVLWQELIFRQDAPWIFRRNGKVHATTSDGQGWKPSRMYYWTSDSNSLAGPWTNHGQVGLEPGPIPKGTGPMFGSKPRWLMPVGDGDGDSIAAWVYGGDRYPTRDSGAYPANEGQNVMFPVTWDSSGKPTVHFEENWVVGVDYLQQAEGGSSGSAPPPADSGVAVNQGGVIRNNRRWYDDRGQEINSNDGGHIARFGDTYYWVGNDLDLAGEGMDIHMYSTKTLGSDDWKWEGKISDYRPGRYASSCTLVQNPRTELYVIYCKGLDVYTSTSITGPYENTVNIWPTSVEFHPGCRWGGVSLFQDYGGEAYVVVSRYECAGEEGNTRHMGIYRLTDDYLDIEEEVLWEDGEEDEGYVRREAPWVFRRNGMYYLTMSHTRGWNPSETYYWTAESLYGPWTFHGEVGYSPDTKNSYNSQHRYIMRVGNSGDQWIFGGDRYPYMEPDVYPADQGQNIILPVTWDGDKPVISWEESWTPDLS